MSSTSSTANRFTLELQRISGLIEAKELQQAAHALNAAQQQAPTDARIFLLGMRLAEHAGNLESATKSARRALALAPQWPIAQVELALLLARQNQADEAIQLATQALASAPNDTHVMFFALKTAHFAKRREQLQRWTEECIRRFLDTDDRSLRIFLAQYFSNQGRYNEAIAQFEYLRQHVPGNAVVLRGLLNCALNVGGQEEKAREYADELLAVLPDEPSAIYWHAVAHGRTPPTQPDELVSKLFDDFAETFDRHLVRGLQYRVPERLAEILRDAYPERRFNLLDLGCGTGLVGVYLQHTIGRIEGALIGVDLSEKMIEQAAQHGIYARFHQVNVLDALEATPADHYEVITCADVLVYVGDLAPVIPNALRILKPNGYFLFSCEAAGEDEADLVLRETNRYAHKASAVERQCREAGFDQVTIEHLPALRTENGKPLPGFLVVAHKPAA
jgi:predicted TPR repeat methyltransferase